MAVVVVTCELFLPIARVDIARWTGEETISIMQISPSFTHGTDAACLCPVTSGKKEQQRQLA